MDFEGRDFIRLKKRETDLAFFEHLGERENEEHDKERISLRRAAAESGLYMFQITGEDKKIILYACRAEGDENETAEIRAEVKSRAARVFTNMWNTTGFISFLSNIEYKNKWFDEKGWDRHIEGKDKDHEPASEQQLLLAGSMMDKRMNSYTELIRMRTFLRNVQAVDDEFEELDRAKAAAKARQLLLKKDIICSHIYADKNLKIVRKGRRACCEPCASAGYLDPDIEFGRKIKDGVEIGFIKTI